MREDGPVTASANVLDNDTRAADGGSVSAVNGAAGSVAAPTAGTYGSVVINADGSYTYTLNNALPAVQALLDGQSLTDSFTYTLSDADGTSSTATLTVTIDGRTDGPPEIRIPDKNGAEAGENTIVEAAPAVTGTIEIEAPDGVATVTVGGTTLTPAQLAALGTTPVTINTGEGTLVLNGYTAGAISYSYTAPAQNHVNGQPILDSIPVRLVDLAGAVDTDSLDILITDTGPQAVNDTNTVREDGPVTASANVLDNDTRAADGGSVSAVNGAAGSVAAPTAGTYGSVVINADGSYTYTLNNALPAVQALLDGQSLSDSFTYTLSDADGTSSTATLTVTIEGRTDGPPEIRIPDKNGAEAGENTIVEAAPAVTGTIEIEAPDGVATVTVGGTTLTPAQLAALGTTPVTINTGEGTLVLNGYTAGAISYSYTAPAQNHVNGQPILDSIPVSLVDLAGAVDTDSLDILITDTGPQAVNDTNTVREDGPVTASANVLANDTRAADGGSVSAVNGAAGSVAAPTAGTYGSVVINADGSYTYTLNNALPAVQALLDGQSLTDSFTYTLSDADGTSSTATLTVTIDGRTDGPPEIRIPDKNGAEAGENTIVEARPRGHRHDRDRGPGRRCNRHRRRHHADPGAARSASATTPVTINTGEGTLVLNGYTAGAISYSYTAPAQNHVNGQPILDSIPVRLVDLAGAVDTDSLDILITDTGPQAVNDTNTVREDGPVTASANVLDNDTRAADGGSVSAVNGAAGSVAAPTAGTYGSVVINADGSYTYTLNNALPAVQALLDGQSLTDSFTYTLSDADGTSSTATLTVTIEGRTDGPPEIRIPDKNGAEAGENTIVEAAPAVTGTIEIEAPDGVATVTVGGTTLTPAQLAALGTTPVTINTGEGTLRPERLHSRRHQLLLHRPGAKPRQRPADPRLDPGQPGRPRRRRRHRQPRHPHHRHRPASRQRHQHGARGRPGHGQRQRARQRHACSRRRLGQRRQRCSRLGRRAHRRHLRQRRHQRRRQLHLHPEQRPAGRAGAARRPVAHRQLHLHPERCRRHQLDGHAHRDHRRPHRRPARDPHPGQERRRSGREHDRRGRPRGHRHDRDRGPGRHRQRDLRRRHFDRRSAGHLADPGAAGCTLHVPGDRPDRRRHPGAQRLRRRHGCDQLLRTPRRRRTTSTASRSSTRSRFAWSTSPAPSTPTASTSSSPTPARWLVMTPIRSRRTVR